ncbi:MAG TPA: nucleotidyl transferase AbiEii/AbiGii toxin family protein [Flavisolibacter sp.]|nr:nucleotidyl transferase AbiEii/AbiGii toxin family protein [Flavisolibacter sp.]
MKREGCKFTSEQLRTALEEQLSALGLPSGTVTIEAAQVPADFPDTDPQTIYVRYPSLYPPLSYIADEVKIEVSVRSLLTPFTTMDVQSLLNEYFPNPVYGETPYSVTAVEPHKTLLEKIFLLHEEFQKPDRARIRSERMSRHLYDVVSMMNTPVEARALQDYALYDHIIIHRKWYTAYTYLDYETLGHTLVQFVPADDLLEAYRRDYETMQEEMIHGDPPDFDPLLRSLKMLQGKVRVKMEGKSLKEIIEKARAHILNALQLQQEATELQIPVTYVADQMHPISAANKTVTYTIHFRREHDGFGFEDIRF